MTRSIPPLFVLAVAATGCGHADIPLPPTPAPSATPAPTVVGSQWGSPREIADAGPKPANPCEGQFGSCRNGLYAPSYPAVALNAGGQGVAAWQRFEGGAFRLVAARYELGRGWDTEVTVDLEPGADKPLLAVDPRGNALMVWRTGGEIRSSYGPVAGSWTKALPLAFGTGPGLAMDDQGRAILVFHQVGIGVRAMRFTPAGWTPAETVEAEDDADRLDISSVSVAMTPAGDMVATWTRNDSGDRGRSIAPNSEVWSSRARPGQAWSAPERLASLDGAVSFDLSTAAGDERVALAWTVAGAPANYWWEVWGQQTTGAAGPWQPPIHLSAPHTSNSTLKRYPAFTTAPRADALLTWTVQEPLGGGIERRRFRGRWFSSSRGDWSETFPIGDRPDDERGRQDLAAAVSAAGTAMGAFREWKRFDFYVLAGLHFAPNGGWSTAQELRAGAISPPAVAMDARGHGLAMWSEWTDERLRIWSAPLVPVTR